MNDPGPGQLLFAFVRFWARRSSIGADTVSRQGRLVLVTEAVNSLTQRGITATVNSVGQEIGIDQSGASRLISSATKAGYLTMKAAATDARKRHIVLTPSGHSMVKHAHAWQEQEFDRLTKGWSDRRRHEFGRALAELIGRSYDHGNPT